jgi:hypothetical protein
MTVTMVCAASVTASLVSGKATRDALFLTSLNFTALPAMLMATSVVSILLVAAHTRATRRISPAVLVPASFVASGFLFLVEWFIRSTAPSATAVIVYLHISGTGPLLASGFWLMVSERFDPRTAKRRFGQIAGAGTLGGLLGGLVAERETVWGGPAMLPVPGRLPICHGVAGVAAGDAGGTGRDIGVRRGGSGGSVAFRPSSHR